MVAIGAHLYGTHMYDGLTQIWRGWRRIYLHGFQKKPFVLFSKAIELLLFSVLPFLIFPWVSWLGWIDPLHYFWPSMMLNATLINILLVAWQASDVIRSRRVYSLLHALGAFMLALIFFDAMKVAITGEKTKWRG